MSREDGSVNLWSLENTFLAVDFEKTMKLRRIVTDFVVGVVVVNAFVDFVGVVGSVVDVMIRMVMMRALGMSVIVDDGNPLSLMI